MNVELSSTLLAIALTKQQKRLTKIKINNVKIKALRLLTELDA